MHYLFVVQEKREIMLCEDNDDVFVFFFFFHETDWTPAPKLFEQLGAKKSIISLCPSFFFFFENHKTYS